MIMYSDITGKTYDTEDAVFYMNVLQSAFMLTKPDMELLDLFTESRGLLTFVFPKRLHKKYILEWRDRPHESNKSKDCKISEVDSDG